MPSTGSSAWDFDFLLPGALGKLAVLCHEAQKAGTKAAFGWGHSTESRKSRPSSGWSGPWGGGFGGPAGAWWPGPPGAATKPAGPRGTKAGRGDVRAAILAVLSGGPCNGYQIMSEIEERSGGAWRPSPGAVYPALQQLADEGLIAGEESAGRRTFSLTDAGRQHVEENPERARAAWEAMAPDEPGEVPGLFVQAARLGGSIVQLAHAGTPGQVHAAEQLLEETRRKMYQILASDDTAEPDEE